MRALILALLAFAAPANAAHWTVSETVYPGSGRYLGQDFHAGAVSNGGRWGAGVRVKSFRYLNAFPGTEVETSAEVSRRLPHVSIGGRIGTAPPNAQRAGYHVAGGDALLTWYGLSLGPSELRDAATVSEDTTTASELRGLDRTWVSTLHARFTTTNHRQPSQNGRLPEFILVQNTWQFDMALAWKDATKLTVSGGGDRYNITVLPQNPTWYLWNVDYAGAPIAVRGWPNNHFGAQLEQKSGDFTARAGFTRLNMIWGGLEILAGGEAAWRPRATGAELRLGWFQRHTRGHETVSVWGLGGGWSF